MAERGQVPHGAGLPTCRTIRASQQVNSVYFNQRGNQVNEILNHIRNAFRTLWLFPLAAEARAHGDDEYASRLERGCIFPKCTC
ncbi:MAG: hypothetical protein ACXABD_19470, partial [Candidatus Thorarchaeota archaeon]